MPVVSSSSVFDIVKDTAKLPKIFLFSGGYGESLAGAICSTFISIHSTGGVQGFEVPKFFMKLDHLTLNRLNPFYISRFANLSTSFFMPILGN